jgi:multiple sugar transport system substrate-binding protein
MTGGFFMSRKKINTAVLLSCLIAVSAVAAGCGADGPKEAKAPAKEGPSGLTLTKDPITLRLYQSDAALTDEEFKNFFIEPVKKVMPNVTLEIVRNKKGQAPQDLVVSGAFPDLIFNGNRFLGEYIRLGLVADLTEMIKKEGMDISKFDPVAVDAIKKQYKSVGGLVALPFSLNFTANFYNKDLFDKFGVPYPKDNMTMDDVLELGKRMSRSDNGVQYLALDTNGLVNFGTAAGLALIDEKTGKSNLLSEGWKKQFEVFMNLNLGIPNNRRDQHKTGVNPFIKDQTTAMFIANGGLLSSIDEAIKTGSPLNWDVVSYPTFKDLPGKGWEVNAHVLALSKTTKYPNEAFKVMSIVSEQQNQLNMTKQSRMSALSDPEMKKQFATALESTKGKNIQGIFKVTHVPIPYRTEEDGFVSKYLNPAADKLMKGQGDINTVLAEAHELANKDIEAALKEKAAK